MRRWKQWLDDEWYGDIVEYKLTGRIAGEPKHGRGTRRAKLQAGRYTMKEGLEGRRGAELMYREVSGELARCLLEKDVPKILH